MTERKASNLHPGQRVRPAFGVKYLADDAQNAASVEAMEFLLDTGPSILLSCGTGWTLKVAGQCCPLGAGLSSHGLSRR